MSKLKTLSLVFRALMLVALYVFASKPTRAEAQETPWGHCVQWGDSGGTWCTCESGPAIGGGFDCQETDDCYRKYAYSWCPLT